MKYINPESLGPPIAAFSNGVQVGDTLFIAGQAALGPNWEALFPGDIAKQTDFTIDRIEQVVKEAGGSLANVVSTTVFISDFKNYKQYNEAYAARFGDARPARATVRADLVNPELLVEIQAIAVLEE